jgi:hypothetical protein
MNKLIVMSVWVVAVALAGCGSKRLAECEAFQATVDKLAKCKALPEETRAEVKKSSTTLKEMFDAIDSAGGIDSAPDDLKAELRSSCKSQNQAIIEMYSKVAPDCLK